MPTDAGSIYSEIRIELDKLKGDLNKVDTMYSQLGKDIKGETDGFEKSATKGFNNISLAGVAAFASIGLAVKKSLTQFVTFSSGLSNVQSVARATTEEMNALRAAALEAGETTAFSATEATDALYNLASAGLDASESTAALDGVLKLAGATQSDLATSSATVTAALSQYNLEADQATKVSNVFAAAIGNSQANMSKLSIAFRQVGPVAGTLGKTLEDTTGALQALFDAGLQGEQAGTALRNIYSRLADQTSTTVEALREMGIKFDQINPQVNSTAEIIGVLNDANIEAGEAIAAFGQEAGPGLLSLLAVGKEGLEDYTTAVTGTQAASEAYRTQLDNLGGDIAIFKSTLEALAISFSEEFEPALRGTVQFLTEMLRKINELPGPVKVFLGILIGAVPVIGAVTAAVSALSGALAVLAGPVGLVIAGVTALGAGIAGIATAVQNSRLDEVQEQFGDLSETIGITNERLLDLVDTSKKLGAEAPEDIEAVILKMKEFQDETGISDDKLDELIQSADRLGATDENIGEVVRTLFDLQENAGLTADQFDEVQRRFLRVQNQWRNLDTVNRQVESLAENTGLTKEAVLQLGIANELVGDLYRDQLEILLDQLRTEREQDSVTRSLMQNEDLRAVKAEEVRDAVIEEAAARQAIREEQERIAALNQSTQDQINATIEELLTQEELQRQGLVTQNEVARQQVDLREQLAEQIIRAGREQGSLTAEQQTMLTQQLASIEYWRQIVSAMEDANEEGETLVENVSTGFADISSQTEDYEMQLLRLVGTEEEIIEAERQRALAATLASGASSTAVLRQIGAINRLYDQLLENIKTESEETKEEIVSIFGEAADEIEEITNRSLSAWNEFSSALSSMSDATAQKQIDDIDSVLNARIASLQSQMNAELEAAGLLERTEIQRLQAQLAEAQRIGDATTAAELQDEIQRLQIKQDYEDQISDAEEDAARERAQVEYDAALSTYRLNITNAIASAAAAILKNYATFDFVTASALSAPTAIATGVQVAAIKENKPEPPSFATGGMIVPRSGINKITNVRNVAATNMQSGGIVIPSGPDGTIVRAAENGAPEMLLNGGREGDQYTDYFAARVANMVLSAMNSRPIQIKNIIPLDGKIVAQNTAEYFNNGKVRLK